MLEEFFAERLSDKLPRCRPETGFYVVRLLVSMASSLPEDVPLVFLVLGPERSVSTLQRAGDSALFVSGFFPEQAKRVSESYYVSLGSAAYGELSVRFSPRLRPVFSELSEKFIGFQRAILELRRDCDRAGMVDIERRLSIVLR